MSLVIKNLYAALNGRTIIKGVDLTVLPGKIHALMGPNGSGKSTLAGAIMGNSEFRIPASPALPSGRPAGRQNSESKIIINKKNIMKLKADKRAREGLFLAFQNPTAIPGVTVANLLRMVYNLKKRSRHKVGIHDAVSTHSSYTASGHNPALSVWEFNEALVAKAKEMGIPQEFLRKSLNEEFSGGEKKKLEMLQALVLSPKYAIFDEIDTGLDVDALKIVASGITKLKEKKTGILIITHYLRILKYIRPDFVHILVDGKIVASGDYKLAQDVEKNGYKKWTK